MANFFCSSPRYEYDGVVFEYSETGMIGPWPMRKDGSPKARAGKKFHDTFAKWSALPDKESYRIGGGCIRF
jgi:hypothetical protein